MSQFDEQKDQVAVEQILRVIFLDAERPSAVSDIRAPSFLLLSLRIQYNSGEQQIHLTHLWQFLP